ncbi:MAG: SurA N-terminal domain-containing protein [Candidatus Omnitrophica bacterium]|nr:SurA N-terminal domain-containing protein [Candidatus Omnitrophota bacterium]
MMKRVIIFGMCFLLLLITSCFRKSSSQIAIEVNGCKVTVEEFEQAFKEFNYGKDDNSSSRKEFLDIFLARKLMLQEAHRLGIDKDERFLKDVEYFWQQSLIKLLLEKKTQELSSTLNVGDDEVRNFYQVYKDKEFKDKDISSVYDQIKFILLRNKQTGAINDWINSLKDKAKINIDYESLKIK